MSDSELVSNASASHRRLAMWNVLLLALAAVAAVGSVYLSLGLGLKACPLCFYQRSFAIAVVLVLAMLLWLDGLYSARACLVALPLSATGLGVAAFHVYLVQVGKLECPPALFGWGDGPSQSLVIFSVVMIVSLAGAWSARQSKRRGRIPTIVAAVLVGAGATWACIASAPPLPPTPAQPYDPVKQPFDMCRPPYRSM